jgi:hypothetical protein
MNKKKIFNPSDYYLIPNTVFQVEEFENAFFDFLKIEVNSEPLDFIQQVKIFKKNEENLEDFGKSIYNDFIQVGAKKWLNIGSELKSLYEQKYNNNKFTEDFFEILENKMKEELLSDSYRR